MKVLFKAQYGCALGLETMVPLSKVQQQSVAVRCALAQVGAPARRRSGAVEFKCLLCVTAAVLSRLYVLTTFPLAQ